MSASKIYRLTNFLLWETYSFFKLYFIDYVITVVPIFSPLPPPSSNPHSLRQSPHHCSWPWVTHINSLATPFPTLYFTFPWLFCNYLFVLLNPLTSSPILSHTPMWQPSKYSLYPWFCLCSCLLCFLDSIVDRHVFLVILMFIVLSFLFLLSKTFNVSYNNGLMMMNSFSFFLSGNLFICPSVLDYIFPL